METVEQTYKVAGNWDQIVRYPGLRSLKWTAENPKVPNRVSLRVDSLQEGTFIFNMLHNSKLVALRNWLT